MSSSNPMPPQPFKLAEVKDPVFAVDFGPLGGLREYDPFKLLSGLEGALPQVLSGDAGQISGLVDRVRKAFGMPDGAESAAQNVPTLTIHQCVALVAACWEFVSGLDAVKKLRGLLQN